MNPDRIGHTGITWPFTAAGTARAMADIAALDYRGFETFGLVVERYPGGAEGLRRELEGHELALASAYCFAPLIDPATASDDIAGLVAQARLLKAAGGGVVVLGAGPRQQACYTAEEYRGMARTLDEVGRRCLDLGVTVAFHPHTGTPVETREEIDAVMGAVDPRAIAFAPDTGQIRKGGSDPLDVLRAYLPLVRHVHLKDYYGGPMEVGPDGHEVDRTGYLNYVPLGQGVVDIPAIVRTLDDAGYGGWWMVELDATPAAPYLPRTAAAISKAYLDGLMSPSNRPAAPPIT